MILYFRVEAPHHWALVDKRGSVVQEGSCDSPGEIPVLGKASAVVTVVAGDLVTVHEIKTPT